MHIPHTITDNAIMVIINGVPNTIRQGSPFFMRLKTALQKGEYEEALKLVSPSVAIQSVSHGCINVQSGKVYRHGKELRNTAVDYLLRILEQGGDGLPMIKFLDNLYQNTSMKSIEAVFDFMQIRFLPITEDGYLLGYKGLKSDFYSVSGNTNTVVLKGTVNSAGRIYNGVGEYIVVERSSVDDDVAHNCSNGIHVGSYSYATSFSQGKVVLCKINPKDVVSVPADSTCEKIRVCEYSVLEDVTGRAEIELAEYNGAIEQLDRVQIEDLAREFVSENSTADEEDFVAWLEEKVGRGSFEDVEARDVYFDLVSNPDEPVESQSCGEYVDRIEKYIESRHADGQKVTIQKIANSLSPVYLGVEKIREIVLDLGYKTNDNKVTR